MNATHFKAIDEIVNYDRKVVSPPDKDGFQMCGIHGWLGRKSRESKGMQGEVLPGQPLKIYVQGIFGLSWVFLGKKFRKR